MEKPVTAEFGSVILAGGQSRRMGRNKALLRLDPAGPTLVEGVVAAVAGRGPIVLVTNTPEEYAFLGLPMVADAPEHPGAGPLAGLYSGLRASTAAYNLTLACDMPRLQPALLDALAALPRDYDALVPRWTAPDGTATDRDAARHLQQSLPARHRRLPGRRPPPHDRLLPRRAGALPRRARPARRGPRPAAAFAT